MISGWLKNAGAAVVTVSVAVDFDGDKEAGDEQEVTLAFTDITGDTFEPTPPSAITVTVAAGNLDQATGQVVLAYSLPPADDNAISESITVTATVAADATVSGEAETDEATLTIVDNGGVSNVTLTLNGMDPLELAEDAGAAVVTVTATVDFVGDQTADATFMVAVGVKNVDTDNPDLVGTFIPPVDDVGATVDITVTVAAGNLRQATGEVVLAYTLPPADDTETANESFILEGTVLGETGEATLTIVDVDIGRVSGVTLTLNGMDPLELAEDAGAVVVTVTATVDFDGDKMAGDTQEVALTLPSGTGSFNLTPTSITATVAAGNLDQATGEVVLAYTLPEPDPNAVSESIEFTGTISTGTVSGQPVTDTATLTIIDGDITIKRVSFSPPTLSFNEGVGSTEMVTVTVHADQDPGPARTVLVELSSSIPLPLGTVNSPVTVTIDPNESSGSEEVSISYSPDEDDDNSVSEMITITGTATDIAGEDIDGAQSGTLIITAVDNDPGAVTSVEFSPDIRSLTENTPFSEIVTVTGQCGCRS